MLESWLERDGTAGKIFPAHRVFDDVLSSPMTYGFEERDAYTPEAGIWADYVHPTAKMHRVVADAFIKEFQ